MSGFSINKDYMLAWVFDRHDLKFRRLQAYAAFMGLSCLLSMGCSSGSDRVRPPSISASTAGEAAVAEFDQDGDQQLSATELDQAPGIQLDSLDRDTDGYLSSGEISDRINEWQESGVGQLSHSLRVKIDKKPLADAEVTLEPYAFLGTNVLKATGVSDSDGVVVLAIEKSVRAAPNVPTMQYGFYRIRISKKSGDKELIPKRFNLESGLGCEVAPNQRSSTKAISISSKQ